MSARMPLRLLNEEATYECTFGRGCPGVCCSNGSPSVTLEEQSIIEQVLPDVLPLMRKQAVQVLKNKGYLSQKTKCGMPMIRVVEKWCIFFNEGCVLHRLGAIQGDAGRYKPIQCQLFPLEPTGDGSWYVRQWNYAGEPWDLHCLNPEASPRPIAESLQAELELASRLPVDFTWEKSFRRDSAVPQTTEAS